MSPSSSEAPDSTSRASLGFLRRLKAKEKSFRGAVAFLDQQLGLEGFFFLPRQQSKWKMFISAAAKHGSYENQSEQRWGGRRNRSEEFGQ